MELLESIDADILSIERQSYKYLSPHKQSLQLTLSLLMWFRMDSRNVEGVPQSATAHRV